MSVYNRRIDCELMYKFFLDSGLELPPLPNVADDNSLLQFAELCFNTIVKTEFPNATVRFNTQGLSITFPVKKFPFLKDALELCQTIGTGQANYGVEHGEIIRFKNKVQTCLGVYYFGDNAKNKDFSNARWIFKVYDKVHLFAENKQLYSVAFELIHFLEYVKGFVEHIGPNLEAYRLEFLRQEEERKAERERQLLVEREAQEQLVRQGFSPEEIELGRRMKELLRNSTS